MEVIDPIKFCSMCWPDVRFYKEQKEIIYSVRDNDETYVPAGNKLGKDFVAAFIALWWFCSRRPARVVTTSVQEKQLEDVLWGEIRRFVALSKVELPILYNHLKIRQLTNSGKVFPNAELIGAVSNTKEGLLGRHSTADFKPTPNDIPRTLCVFDEASGINDETFNSTQTWAQRKLIIGNPFPCANFFFRGVEAGDVPRDNGDGFHRKIIHIRAVDSPNIRLALEEMALGREPSGEELVPGVKDYREYLNNRKLWDEQLQCIGLDAEFYKGKTVLMYPPDWRHAAVERWLELRRLRTPRQAKAVGIDTAEGGDNTSMAAVDELGVIEIVSEKTPDTNKIPGACIAFGMKHGVPAYKWFFDRGGGGKQHADRLRGMGYPVQTVAFGEPIALEPKRGITLLETKRDVREERYAYKNRRAEMSGNFRERLDPSLTECPRWALPPSTYGEPYARLHTAMAPMPLLWDEEGRMRMLPKRKKAGATKDANEPSLEELIGFSPDEFDAVVLGLHGMLAKPLRTRAGVLR